MRRRCLDRLLTSLRALTPQRLDRAILVVTKADDRFQFFPLGVVVNRW